MCLPRARSLSTTSISTDTHTATFVLKSTDAAADLPGFAEGTGPGAANIGTFALTPITEGPSDVNLTGTLGWHFTLADNDPVLQSLAEGETITQVYTVTVTDNHGASVNQDVTVTITGTNDAPVITSDAAAASGAVTEDVNLQDVLDVSGTVVGHDVETSGTLGFRDVDLIDTHTASAVFTSSTSSAALPGFVDGTTNIGTFTIDPSVTENNTDTDNTGSLGWHFTLADNDPVLQSLAEGETITQVYTVTVTDNHGASVNQDVTVTITGTNDAPVITSDAAAASGVVTEDVNLQDVLDVSGTVVGHDVETSGTLGFRDVDLIDTHTASAVFTSSTSSAALPGFVDGTTNIGTFTIDPSVTENNTDTDNTGSLGWHFTLDDNNPVLQSLAEGETITQVYTVTVTDNHGASVNQDVTVTITGTNDAPVITSDAAAASGAVTEDVNLQDVLDVSGTVVGHDVETSGTLGFRDVDLIDTHTASAVFTSSTSSAALPGFVDGTTNIGTFTIDPSVTENNTDTDNTGSLGWHFTLDDSNPVLQSLAEGETITQVYTVTVTDNHGASVNQDVTVTITGTNDAPVITAATPSLTTIDEDQTTNDGQTVASIVGSSITERGCGRARGHRHHRRHQRARHLGILHRCRRELGVVRQLFGRVGAASGQHGLGALRARRAGRRQRFVQLRRLGSERWHPRRHGGCHGARRDGIFDRVGHRVPVRLRRQRRATGNRVDRRLQRHRADAADAERYRPARLGCRRQWHQRNGDAVGRRGQHYGRYRRHRYNQPYGRRHRFGVVLRHDRSVQRAARWAGLRQHRLERPSDAPAASTTLTLTIDDGGSTGSGGSHADSVAATINITPVNDAPAGTDETIAVGPNTAYTFAASDFGFSDPLDNPADALQAVEITTLPDSGALTDNGVEVTSGQFISLADIDAGKLVYTSAQSSSGSSFTFQVQDDGGIANGGVDLDQSANTITIDIASFYVSGAGNTVNYTEQATPVAVDNAVTVFDGGNPTLAGSTATISAGFQLGDTLTINGATDGDYTAGPDGGAIHYQYELLTQAMSLSGTATLADYNAALQLIAFSNPSNDDPTAAALPAPHHHLGGERRHGFQHDCDVDDRRHAGERRAGGHGPHGDHQRGHALYVCGLRLRVHRCGLRRRAAGGADCRRAGGRGADARRQCGDGGAGDSRGRYRQSGVHAGRQCQRRGLCQLHLPG